MNDGTRDPVSDLGDLRRQCEQYVAAHQPDRPAPLLIRQLLALVDDQTQQIEKLKGSAASIVEGARRVTPEELEPFMSTMRDEVIPEIVEAVKKRAQSAADARGKVLFKGPPSTLDDFRIAFETEQTLHAAWEKRAYEAEASLAAQALETEQLKENLDLIFRGKSPCGHWSAHAISSDGGKHITCLECRMNTAEAALLAAQPYLQHFSNCDLVEGVGFVDLTCSCGLAALQEPPA